MLAKVNHEAAGSLPAEVGAARNGRETRCRHTRRFMLIAVMYARVIEGAV